MDGQVRERHPSLTVWLTLLALANGFSAVIYGFMWISLLIIKSKTNSNASISFFLPALAITSLVALGFILAVYKWKKWGLYGFAVTTLITFAINMKLGVNNLMAIFGLIGIAFLVYLIRPHWEHMDNL